MIAAGALILGAGGGIVVTTTDDKTYAITVKEPEEPAGVLTALARQVE